MAARTSKDFGLRFFYFVFACLLYSILRAVDLLVQVELIGEYEHAPMVTADNTLTLLEKETGIGEKARQLDRKTRLLSGNTWSSLGNASN